MKLHRIGLKLYFTADSRVDLDAFTPVFHRWIQNASVPGTLIDVANYAHVPSGPGVMLIAHQCDYGIDMAEGRPGLNYVRKQNGADTIADSVREAYRSTLIACRGLEEEPALKGQIGFQTDEALLSIYDRLQAPNTEETFDSLHEELKAVLSGVYDGAELSLSRAHADPRESLAARIQSSQEISLATLLERVEAVSQNAD